MHVTRVVAVMALALAGVVLGAAPAQATSADGGLLLSADGVHFTDSYRGELFTAIDAMVPGDEQQGKFWVRNATSDIAYLRVGVGSVGDTTASFLQSLTLSAGAGGAASTAIGLTESMVCTSLLTPIPLAAGASVRIDLAIGLAREAPVQTQDSSTKITMVASLSNASPSQFGDNICRGDFDSVPTDDPTASPSPEPSITLAAPTGTGEEILGNTARWFEEYAIIVPVLAFAAGATLRLQVERRSARLARHPEGTPHP